MAKFTHSELIEKTDDLLKRIAQTQDTEEFKKWVEFLKSGYAYSFGNYMLAAVQFRIRTGAHITDIRSFNAWRKLGRFPKKDTGLAILVPFRTMKKYDANGRELPRYSRQKPAHIEYGSLYFGVGYVFDVSDTEGEPLPEVKWWAEREDEKTFTALMSFCETQNIKVEMKDSMGSARGASGGGIIYLTTKSVKTFVHEIAHELLHQKRDEKKVPYATGELEAETVAYVVCAHLGIEEADASAAYLANWKASQEGMKASLGRIEKTTRAILKALHEEVDEPETETEPA